MSVKIFSYPNDSRVQMAMIAAKYGGVEVEFVETKIGADTVKPEFLEKNPIGKVPAALTPEGPLFESMAIVRYVARNNFYPKDNYSASLADAWMDFAANELYGASTPWFYQMLGFLPKDLEAVEGSKKKLERSLKALESYLESRTFLVGERITVADVVVTLRLNSLFMMLLGRDIRNNFPNVMRYYNTVINQENVKAVVGKVKLTDKDGVVPEPKKAEEKKEEKPAEEKKPVNPLDLLPPSKLVLDEFKRLYSNASDTRGALKKFWEEMFDKEGYCLYTCEYKYQDELEPPIFKTANLIAGFFQRLDRLRKYGFGSMCIFRHPTKENKLNLAGAWLFRGDTIPAEMLNCDDSELYDWVKMDADNEKERKIIDDYWCWEGDFTLGEFADGAIFK